MASVVIRLTFALVSALLISSTASAITMDAAMITTDDAGTCTPPSPTTIVTVASPQVRLWFNITDRNIGDVAKVEWYSPGPSSQLAKSSSYSPATTAGRGCYADTFLIANHARQVGPWLVKILWNSSIVRTLTFTIGPLAIRGDVSVRWVTTPPSTLTSGQPFDVAFDIEGASVISYRIHYSTNQDPSTYAEESNKTAWSPDRPAGIQYTTLTAPVVSSPTTYYFVVHGWVGQVDYFSFTASSLISPASSSSPPPPLQPRGPAAPTPITIGQTITGSLDSNDNPPSQPDRISHGAYAADQYSFVANAGTDITIAMTATFDSYLYLLKNGSVIMYDDDSASNRQARIPPNGTFRLTAAGTYVIEATSFDAAAGSYTLSLTGTPQTTTPPTTPPPSNIPTWVYRNDPNLPGLVAVLQKERVGSSSVYRYGIVIAQDSASFNGGVEPLEAFLTIASKYDTSIKVLKSSLKGQSLESSWPPRDTSEFLRQLDTVSWRDGASHPFSDKEMAVAKDVLGFIPFGGIGLVVSIASTLADVAALFPDQIDAVGPSNTFAREVGSDDYLTQKVEIHSGLFSPAFAYRFSVSVEETGTEQPHFFIRLRTAATSPSRIVGIEILNNRAVPIIKSVERY